MAVAEEARFLVEAGRARVGGEHPGARWVDRRGQLPGSDYCCCGNLVEIRDRSMLHWMGDRWIPLPGLEAEGRAGHGISFGPARESLGNGGFRRALRGGVVW
jgi:hypothetical protein